MALAKDVAGGVRIAVKVVTRASRNRVAGRVGDRLKVCVTAPPERGRANELVEETLAEFFGVGCRTVRIVSGATSSIKEVEVAGISVSEVETRLS
jgi:hypothetical protein